MPNGVGMGGHQTPYPQTDEWITPKWIIDALGGADSFDLDPCAAREMPWPTAREMRWERGLDSPWYGRVWLNPPYTRGIIDTWTRALADHGNGVALIFARIETDHWHRNVWARASAVLFLQQRLFFHYVDGRRAGANAGAASALVVYGEEELERIERVHAQGHMKGHLITDWT